MKYALLSILITMSSVRVTMPLYSYGVRSDSVCPISDYSGEELRENYHVIAVLRSHGVKLSAPLPYEIRTPSETPS